MGILRETRIACPEPGLTIQGVFPPSSPTPQRRVPSVKVHERAARIIVGPHPVPHGLHRLLLQEFPSARDVRLVTADFDTHFSTAANAAFESAVEESCAPVLPLGDDFSGLVYLHGCAGRNPAPLCADRRGFRSRLSCSTVGQPAFSEMFSRYVVLFVGYSHDDTVMN